MSMACLSGGIWNSSWLASLAGWCKSLSHIWKVLYWSMVSLSSTSALASHSSITPPSIRTFTASFTEGDHIHKYIINFRNTYYNTCGLMNNTLPVYPFSHSWYTSLSIMVVFPTNTSSSTDILTLYKLCKITWSWLVNNKQMTVTFNIT